MKKLLLSVSVLSLTILNSCTQDTVNEDTELELVSSIQNESNIKRDRLKQRNNGLYKAVKIIDNTDDYNQVATIDLQLKPYTGGAGGQIADVIPEVFTVMTKVGEVNKGSGIKFISKNIETYNDLLIDGILFEASYTLKNKEGKPIGDILHSFVTAESLQDGLKIKNVNLKLNKDGETFSSKVKIEFNEPFEGPAPDDLSVKVTFQPLDGGAELEAGSTILNFLKVTSFNYTKDQQTYLKTSPTNDDWILFFDEADAIFGKKVSDTSNNLQINSANVVFKNTKLSFIEPDNVVDMEYLMTVQLYGDDEELDYAEFRITGLE